MVRKIAILMPLFLLCLALDNCKNPEEPEPEPNYYYRYDVEVIYTRVSEGSGPNYVNLHYHLYDPGLLDLDPPQISDSGSIKMSKIGKNKYGCYLPKVFVQTSSHHNRHRVNVIDNTEIDAKSSSIDIQGAYDLEVSCSKNSWGNWEIWVTFRMSFE